MRCINKWKRVLVAAGLVTILLGSTACSVLKKDSASYQLYQTSSDYGLASDVISPVNMLKTTHLAVKNPKKSSKFNIFNVKSAAVIDVSARKIKYEYQLFQKVYPASTTKLLTAYIALKYGNLSDRITVSTSAAAVPTGSSVAGLKAGDQITLEDALYGLILRSGNDCANVIAEHISGNISKFALLMNQEAKSMGATKTHFVNPHGFPDPNHYTTTYDLYCIFSTALQNQQFDKFISTKERSVSYKNASGKAVHVTWKSTDWYFNGQARAPEGVTVLGGKTGSSDSSGYCLVLFSKNKQNKPYITIVMGSKTHSDLYRKMNQLLSAFEL